MQLEQKVRHLGCQQTVTAQHVVEEDENRVTTVGDIVESNIPIEY